jgi:hypothetical protein
MRWVAAAGRELIGLFIDDGSLALVALAWLALCAVVLPRLGLTPTTQALLLFAGLALGLVENARRAARQKRRS